MHTPVETHGMDKTRVAPDWPPLSLDEVRAVLAEFSRWQEPFEILSVSPRPFSAASVIATRNEDVFIKRHSITVRDREGLLEEHRFLAHLKAHGASVPLVYTTLSGESVIEIGEWCYEVHEAPSYFDIYQDALSWTPFLSSVHAYSAGQALARLHLTSQGFSAPKRKPRPLVSSFTIFAADDPNLQLQEYLAVRPELEAYLHDRSNCKDALELLAPYHAELLPLLPTLSPLWTHNDLHASNLLWSSNSDQASAAVILDFGLADRTCAVHDIAIAIERNIVEWLELENDLSVVPIHLDHLQALLDGYQSIRPLADAEAAALAPMTALCHAEYALTEADYFLRVLHSEEKAPLAIDGYLLGHARWFHLREGAQLLHEIEQWSERRKHSPCSSTQEESNTR